MLGHGYYCVMRTNRPLGRMLISASAGREIDIDITKVSLGSFYTTNAGWLTSQVKNFLQTALENSKGVVLDPFAGDGHLLKAIQADNQLGSKISKVSGFDIQGQSWPINDSLVAIPNPDKAVILTNPPYLANHSAKRKGIETLVEKYFNKSTRKNLYQIALENALAVADYVVAIIPETFLLSSFPKQRLVVAVVIQDALFGDTEAPALVACFGPKGDSIADIFTGEKKIGNFEEIFAVRNRKPITKHKIVFNDPKGRIGLRAVDGSDGESEICFLLAENFAYPTKSVLVSSRLMTYLEIPELPDKQLEQTINLANTLLASLRVASADLVLAPFKGNDKNGKRRRRLDYALARRILNQAVSSVRGEK